MEGYRSLTIYFIFIFRVRVIDLKGKTEYPAPKAIKVESNEGKPTSIYDRS